MKTHHHVSVPQLSLRVLVIDDNPVNQQLWAHMLRRLGHRSLAVATGFEAMEALEQFPFDVVLVDLDRAAINGIESVSQIRHRAGHPDTPWIIGTTANPEGKAYDRAMEAGVNDFMIKSGHFENLSRAMRFAERSVRNPAAA